MNGISRKLIEFLIGGVFDFIHLFENSTELLQKQSGLTKDMIIFRKLKKKALGLRYGSFSRINIFVMI